VFVINRWCLFLTDLTLVGNWNTITWIRSSSFRRIISLRSFQVYLPFPRWQWNPSGRRAIWGTVTLCIYLSMSFSYFPHRCCIPPTQVGWYCTLVCIMKTMSIHICNTSPIRRPQLWSLILFDRKVREVMERWPIIMTPLTSFWFLLHIHLLTFLLVILPIWNSSPVIIAAVGYRSKANRRFITLFNPFDPHSWCQNAWVGFLWAGAHLSNNRPSKNSPFPVFYQENVSHLFLTPTLTSTLQHLSQWISHYVR